MFGFAMRTKIADWSFNYHISELDKILERLTNFELNERQSDELKKKLNSYNQRINKQ